MFQLLQQTLTLDQHVAIRELSDKDLGAYLTQMTGQDLTQLQLQPRVRELLIKKVSHIKTFPVSRQQLEFEAEVEIVPGSTKPRNTEDEFNQLVQGGQLLGPIVFTVEEYNEALLARFEQLSPEVAKQLAAVALRKVELDAVQAGRFQGGSPQPAAGQNGGGSVQSQVQQQAPQPAAAV